MNIPLPQVGDFVSAFGSTFNDGRSLLTNLADENYQADVTKAPEVWAHTASVLSLLATSAQSALAKMPPAVLSEVGKLGLAANVAALIANVSTLTTELTKPNTPESQTGKILAGLGVLSALAGTAASFDALLVGAGLAAQFPWAGPLAIVATSVSMVWQARESFIWAGNEYLQALEDASHDSTFLGDMARSLMVISSYLSSTADPLVKSIKYVMVDPLVLDLDGDGLEITPLSRGVQFDGNGDTIRTNTSWVQADDGLLVLDRNGNGVIDSGRELFGDETLLADGTKAAHGFAALAELDVGGAANATGGAGDGVFDAKDAQYTNVRVWRDLNQDGISQAGEMQTLQEAGIASVKLSSTKTETNYGDAQLVQSGSFTRADGSEGQAGSFILAQNNAVTTHAPIAISAEAAALMAMGTASAALPANQGSGWVRNLQEAATLTPRLLECCRQRPGRHLCRSVTSRHWCQSSPPTSSRADG